MGACRLGHRQEVGPPARIVDRRLVPDDRAQRKGGDSRLEVQRPSDRHPMNPDAKAGRCTFQRLLQLGDPRLVGAATDPDPDIAAPLEHIAAVQRAGRLDRHAAVADRLQHLPETSLLGSTRRRARAAEDGDVAEHDDLVLDEDAVRAVVDGGGLANVPTSTLQCGAVLLPLPHCEIGVDRRRPLDVVTIPSASRGDGRRTRARRRCITRAYAVPRAPGDGGEVPYAGRVPRTRLSPECSGWSSKGSREMSTMT